MAAQLDAVGDIILVIEKEFAHPPEAVFEAWLDSDQICHWWDSKEEIDPSEYSVNPVEGGHYLFKYRDPAGAHIEVTGIYQTIERFSVLEFTWAMAVSAHDVTGETLVSIHFRPTKMGTKVHLKHRRFADENTRDCHAEGWQATLTGLVNFLEKRQ